MISLLRQWLHWFNTVMCAFGWAPVDLPEWGFTWGARDTLTEVNRMRPPIYLTGSIYIVSNC